MASNSLIHFWLLLCNHWMKFNETWLVSRSQHPLPSLWFLGRFENQDDSPGLWLAGTFVFFSATAEQILTGSQISLSSAKIVFYGLIRKSRWLPWPLIGWDIFYFFSATAEQNLTKLDRKQDLNILSWVFFYGWSKNNMVTLTSEWLRHFLLLCNPQTEFDQTWRETRCQRPLANLCFTDRSKNQDGCPSLWFGETF